MSIGYFCFLVWCHCFWRRTHQFMVSWRKHFSMILSHFPAEYIGYFCKRYFVMFAVLTSTAFSLSFIRGLCLKQNLLVYSVVIHDRRQFDSKLLDNKIHWTGLALELNPEEHCCSQSPARFSPFHYSSLSPVVIQINILINLKLKLLLK